MMSDAEQGRQRRKRGFLIAGIGIFFLIILLPPPESLEIPARNMIAVAALMALWWIGEAAPLPVTALLPLALFPLLGILPSAKTAPFYGNHLIFLFLGGFLIALSMERWGLHKRIALAIILKTGTELHRIVLGFMLACAFLSMWISNTATTLMLLPVAMAVVRQLADHTKLDGQQNAEAAEQFQKNFGLVLMLALAYSASIGGIGTLIGTPPNIVFAGFYKTQFPDRDEVSFLQWMLVAWPMIILFLPMVWWGLLRWVPTISLNRFETHGGVGELLQHERHALGPMSRAERFIAIVFVTTAFLWIFRKPIVLGPLTLPGWSQLLPWPGGVHDATVAMVMGLLLMIVPLGWDNQMIRDDKPEPVVLDWETVRLGVPWGILLLFGGGFALAGGIKATGLDLYIGHHLAAVGDWPLWLVILSLCLGLTFLTELTSNTATATMILPVIAAASDAAGIEPLMLMVPATLSVSCAFMMPVATPPNAIVFSSGWVTVPQMARAGLLFNLIGALLITLLTLFWVPVVLL